MTESPGRSGVFNGSPENQLLPPLLAESTDPSARMTNTPFLSAIGVGPPAWLKYHFAERPDWALIAVGLNTCPLTVTTLAFFGITNSSPSRRAISAGVFLHLATSDWM